MHADTIREFLRREPFELFAIRPSNGEGHEIRHPGCALLMKTKVIVGYPDEDRTGLSGTGAGLAKIGSRSGFSRPGFPFAGMLGA